MNKEGRRQLGKDTINGLIPRILNSNDRARDGVSSSTLIRYDPSLAPPKGSQPVAARERAMPLPKIKVIQSDTFDAAQAVIQSSQGSHTHRRVAVLNMCSALRPGGGVLNGSRAQEESLCTRSTLYHSLHDHFYRIPQDSAIYSPDVLVFRTSDNVDLPKKDWFYLDVISCSALRCPQVAVKHDGMKVYEAESSREAMSLKIRLIMQIAGQKGISHLILGALGCGAYKNPPLEVARIFKRVICGDRKRPGVTGIEEIHFAIFDDGENLRTFCDIFQDVLAKR